MPDNLITPDEDESNTTETDKDNSLDETQSSSSAINPTKKISTTVNGTDKEYTTAISLYNKQPQDNTAFRSEICSPGIMQLSITKYRFLTTVK